jgi:hypothetical protein
MVEVIFLPRDGRPGRGAGGVGDGVRGALPLGDDAELGGGAGPAWLRAREGRGAGPVRGDVGGQPVPALWQQAALRPDGAELTRGHLLPGGGLGLLLQARGGRRQLPRGLLHLLECADALGTGAARPFRLRLPAPAPGRRRAAGARQCGAGPGARGAPEGRAGRSADARLRPGGRSPGVGHAGGVGARTDGAKRGGIPEGPPRVGRGALARPGED